VGCSRIGFGALRLRSPLCMYCLYLARFLNRGDFEEVLERVRGLGSRTDVFTETYGIVADGDPYRERKAGLNLRVLGLVGMLPTDGLGVEWLLRLGAAANVVDIEVPGYSFDEAVLERLGREVGRVVFRAPREAVVRLVESASRVVYLLDNAGEAVFDVFVGLMLALRGARVYFVARSMPYEVDVTVDEAEWLVERVAQQLGVGGLLGRVEVVGTGGRYSGFALRRVDERVVDLMASADVVVSKGIANFEAYLDYREDVEEVIGGDRLVFLLCAKCPVLAGLFGVDRGTPVVFSPSSSCSWC